MKPYTVIFRETEDNYDSTLVHVEAESPEQAEKAGWKQFVIEAADRHFTVEKAKAFNEVIYIFDGHLWNLV